VIYLPAGTGLDKYSLFGEVPFFATRILEFVKKRERQGAAAR